MKKNKDTHTNVNGSASGRLALGMPKEMNIVDICRGMQTGWPQLVAAMKKLANDPNFCNSFSHSYASGKGLAIGRPQQLLETLTIDPSWLTRSTPPRDVYAWSVWMTMRVYEAAKTVSSTLKQLPTLFSVTKGANPAGTGALVKEMLAGQHGLIQTAEDIIARANDFAAHLETLGGDLDAAQTEYMGAASAFESLKLANGTGQMMKTIGAHPDAVIASHHINTQLDTFQVSAAKVTAFAVITNMRLAILALATAWNATKEQLETVAGCDAEKLGDMTFLQDSLKLDAATSEWAAFTEVIHNFMKMALLIR